MNKNIVNYVLLILGALTTYYGYLYANCGCTLKFLPSVIIGWTLIIVGLVRIK